MIIRNRTERRTRSGNRRNPSRGRSLDLVGRDFAKLRLGPSPSTRPVAAALVGLLLAGLALAALRIDNRRLRYALAEAVAEEKALLEERRVWTAREATLADPTRLAEIAEERGFERPTRVIDLRPSVQVASQRP